MSLWPAMPDDADRVEQWLREAIEFGKALVAAGNIDGHNLITLAEHALEAIARGEDGSIPGMLAHVGDYRGKLKKYSANDAAHAKTCQAIERKRRIQAHADTIRSKRGNDKPPLKKNAIATEIFDCKLNENLSADRISRLIT